MLQVSRSNWEATHLNTRQLRYAALDALITGDLFRGLRALHAAPKACPGCPLSLGVWPGNLDLHCYHPECSRKKAFASVSALLAHMQQKGHPSSLARCLRMPLSS